MPPTNPLAAELRGILDDLHDSEHGAVPKPLVRERLQRLAEHVEAVGATTGATFTGELDVAAAGLDPEQEIRARALAAAIEHLATTCELPDWVYDGDLAEPVTVLELADRYADWIRDGSPADDDVEEASTR